MLRREQAARVDGQRLVGPHLDEGALTLAARVGDAIARLQFRPALRLQQKPAADADQRIARPEAINELGLRGWFAIVADKFIVGNVFGTSRSSLLLGAGPQAVVSVTDAVYVPLAARMRPRRMRPMPILPT